MRQHSEAEAAMCVADRAARAHVAGEVAKPAADEAQGASAASRVRENAFDSRRSSLPQKLPPLLKEPPPLLNEFYPPLEDSLDSLLKELPAPKELPPPKKFHPCPNEFLPPKENFWKGLPSEGTLSPEVPAPEELPPETPARKLTLTMEPLKLERDPEYSPPKESGRRRTPAPIMEADPATEHSRTRADVKDIVTDTSVSSPTAFADRLILRGRCMTALDDMDLAFEEEREQQRAQLAKRRDEQRRTSTASTEVQSPPKKIPRYARGTRSGPGKTAPRLEIDAADDAARAPLPPIFLAMRLDRKRCEDFDEGVETEEMPFRVGRVRPTRAHAQLRE